MTNTSWFSSISDTDLVAELYFRHKGIIYKTVIDHLENPSDLDDVVQETIIRLMQNLPTVRRLEEKACAVYIARTAFAAAMDFDRKTARERGRFIGLQDITELASSQDLEASLIEQETLKRRLKYLQEVLELLSDTDRELLIGKYIREESDDVIAARLGLKPGTMRMRLMRARNRARKLMEKKESADER